MADEAKIATPTKGSAIANPNKFTMYIILGLIALLICVMVMATILIINLGQVKTPKTIIQTIPAGNYPQNGMEGNNLKTDEFGLLVPLNEVIVNLSAADGAEHFIKVNVTLEVSNNEKVKEEVVKRVPQLRDLVISILRTKTKENIDEKEGKEKLSSEISIGVNRILGGNKVRHVFFEDFMIQ